MRDNCYRSFYWANFKKRQHFTNYNSSCRPLSTARSRSTPASRRFVDALQSSSLENPNHYTESFSKSKDKVEVNMYTSGKTYAIRPTSWFFILYIHSQDETDSIFSSRLEMAFLIHSGASILVLKIPTYMLATQMFNVCNQN